MKSRTGRLLRFRHAVDHGKSAAGSGIIPEHWPRRVPSSPGSLDSLKILQSIHRTLRRFNRRFTGSDRIMDNTREQFPPEEFARQHFRPDEQGDEVKERE